VRGAHGRGCGLRLLLVAKGDRQHRAEGAQQASEAVRAICAVLRNGEGHERMCDLHEQRAPATEQEDAFAMDEPDCRTARDGPGIVNQPA
jgi:hypothetical protein